MGLVPCEECGFPRYKCGDCFDTLIITEYHGEYGGEYETEYACPKCDPEDLNKGLWEPNHI